MAFTIQNNVAGVADSGRPSQGHLQYAKAHSAYWAFYLTSTNQIAAVYSTDGSTWTPPTGSPFGLANAHGSEGRNFGFFGGDISGTDVLWMTAAYGGTNTQSYMRSTLGTTWAVGSETSLTGNVFSPSGNSGCFDSSSYPTLAVPQWGPAVYAIQSSAADSGSSWSGTFAGTSVYAGHPSSTAIFPLTSRGLVLINDDGSGSGSTFTQLYGAVWSGSAWGTSSAIFGSSLTAAPCDAWGACGRSASDIHVVALSNDSNAYTHARFNGSAWSAGNTISTLAYGTSSGVSLVSDGTNVWMAVFDSTKTLQVNKWNGTAWVGWTQQEAARTNTPAYLTGVYNGSNQIMWMWTEYTGSQYNLMGTTLATVAPSGRPGWGQSLWGHRSGAPGFQRSLIG